MIIKATIGSILFLALAGVGMSASATQVIDQSSVGTSSNNTGTTNPTIGQSFTASLGLIDFASFSLYATTAASYRVDILSGSGFGGTLLGSSNTVALTVGTTVTDTEFDFASQIALVVGSTYTLQLVQVGSAPLSFKLGAGITRPGTYAAGTTFSGANVQNDNIDFAFSEGYTMAAAVPEPADAALLMAGLGVVGLLTRRRQSST